MLRLSLCCKFNTAPIKFRTTTARYLKTLETPLVFLGQLIEANVNALEQAITYGSEHHIGGFRVNSDFFPSITHPDQGYQLANLPNYSSPLSQFAVVNLLAQKLDVRLSFHPDQFVILNSPKPEVVNNSLSELEYHGQAADLIGADVINIHGRGGYGDKDAALKRFSTNFKRLSPQVQTRLTVENDDITYSPSELLPLGRDLGIPLVYDVHHHRCLKDDLSIESATTKALDTWNREPLFHISSPKDGWSSPKPKKHADTIDPSDVPVIWKNLPNLTLDIEAKAKEDAEEALYTHLKIQGWSLL